MNHPSLVDISNNNLTGVIPSWIGELSPYVLLLSNNSLEGEIHISLFNISYILDLSANTLSEDIPLSWRSPTILFLQDNNLSGVIPDTLLGNVFVLDLRNNKFLSASGPAWKYFGLEAAHFILVIHHFLWEKGFIIHKLLFLWWSLVYRVFSTKRFPCKIEATPRLKLNLQQNTDMIPTWWKSPIIVWNGSLRNELSGDIPEDLGGLLELEALNLSYNKLSGLIPKIFSGLKNMEIFDLSFNSPDPITTNITDQPWGFQCLVQQLIRSHSTRRTFNHICALRQSINTSCDNNHYQEPDNGVKDDESSL
ncbi:LOW QUALITY PROTEIN: hypothetical protein HID58_073218, partial [Brassica napus]